MLCHPVPAQSPNHIGTSNRVHTHRHMSDATPRYSNRRTALQLAMVGQATPAPLLLRQSALLVMLQVASPCRPALATYRRPGRRSQNDSSRPYGQASGSTHSAFLPSSFLDGSSFNAKALTIGAAGLAASAIVALRLPRRLSKRCCSHVVNQATALCQRRRRRKASVQCVPCHNEENTRLQFTGATPIDCTRSRCPARNKFGLRRSHSHEQCHEHSHKDSPEHSHSHTDSHSPGLTVSCCAHGHGHGHVHHHGEVPEWLPGRRVVKRCVDFFQKGSVMGATIAILVASALPLPFSWLKSAGPLITFIVFGIPALCESLSHEMDIHVLMSAAAFASAFIGHASEGATLLVLFAISGLVLY